MPPTFEGMSGHPVLGVTRDGDKGLKVVQIERSPIAPRSGLILDAAWRETTPGTFPTPC